MNFLANENIPLKSVRLLQDFEHDIVAIVENSPGAKDEDILQRACTEKRIILTFDRISQRVFIRPGLSPCCRECGRSCGLKSEVDCNA